MAFMKASYRYPTRAASTWLAKKGRRGEHRKYRPYVFTEHGAIMAAMILNSPRAVETSVYVVRAFVQLRGKLAADDEAARKFAKLEQGQETRAIGFFELKEKGR